MNQTPQPITLSPDEYQNLLTELALRDPVMRFLMQKQEQAQAAAAQAGAHTSDDKPLHVVGGIA